MSRDYDWKEADRLVEQLRAKLAEDPDFLNDPDKVSELKAEPPKAPKGVDRDVLEEIRAKKAARREAARLRRERAAAQAAEAQSVIDEVIEQGEAEPVAVVEPAPEAAPEAEPVPAPVVSAAAAATFVEDEAPPAPVQEPTPRRSARKEKKVKFTVAEPAQEEAPEQEAADVAVQKRVMAAPLTNRKNLFASAYRHDEDDYVARPVLTGKKTPTRRVEVKLPEVEEIAAEETVDDIVKDLFGTADGWFTEPEPKSFQGPMQVVDLDIEEREEPVRIEPEAKEPEEAEEAEERYEEIGTVTREQDGQISLDLPTAPAAEPVAHVVEPPREERTSHRKTLEERLDLVDDGQLDLFSMVSMEPQRDPAAQKADDEESRSDRMDLKRSIESSEEDFRLLMELDYENELGHAIGFEKIQSYHEEGFNGPALKKGRRRRADTIDEYERQSDDVHFRKIYTRARSSYLRRLILSLSLTFVLFLYETFDLFALLFGGPFDGNVYADAYVLLGMQLLVIIAFFSRQRLIEGFVRLVRFSPIDCSLCSVMLLATLGYHVTLLFLPIEGKPDLYLTPAAVSISLLILADLLNWYRESLAYQVVSSRKQKYALLPRVSVGGKEGDARVRLSEDDDISRTLYARPVGFVRNYRNNTSKRIAHSRTLGAQLLLILSVGCALGLLVLALGSGGGTALRTTFVSFMFCAPTASLLVTALPMALGAKLRLRNRSAIIGEEPIYQCAGRTVLVMPDNEAFATMNHERFELVKGCDDYEVTVLVRGLLDKLSSPLRQSVSVDRSQRMDPERIQLTEVADDGVSALVDGKTVMLLGSIPYLRRYGYSVNPRSAADPDDVYHRLICAVIDGKVQALFLARYRLNDNMIDLIREMDEADVELTIRSKDPGVNRELLGRLMPDRREPLSVMKPAASEIELNTERVDATIVSLVSCKETARAFVTCRRIRRARYFGKLCQALSVGAGALIAGALAVWQGVVAIPSFAVSLYLILWCGLHAVTSYFYLREKNDD